LRYFLLILSLLLFILPLKADEQSVVDSVEVSRQAIEKAMPAYTGNLSNLLLEAKKSIERANESERKRFKDESLKLENDKAKEYFEKGNSFYVNGDFVAALKEYEAALVTAKDPSLRSTINRSYKDAFSQQRKIDEKARKEEAVKRKAEETEQAKVRKEELLKQKEEKKRTDKEESLKKKDERVWQSNRDKEISRSFDVEKKKASERRISVDNFQAKKHFEKGNELYEKGDFAGALTEYGEALKKVKNPSWRSDILYSYKVTLIQKKKKDEQDRIEEIQARKEAAKEAEERLRVDNREKALDSALRTLE